MSAFEKVKIVIENRPVNGHALRNIQNLKSLAKAEKEIRKALGMPE